jgi:anaerobic magnesium-protoporphyrin IX monomethyl ester cyclase
VQHAALHPPPGWSAAYDLAIPGEPEEAVPEMAKALHGGTPLALLQERWPSRGTGTLELVADPDRLPAPRFAANELAAHPFPFPFRGGRAARWGYAMTAWGCPRPCRHCSAIVRKSVGRPLRCASIPRVLDQVEGLVEAGAQALAFEDDSLFVHRRRFLELAEGLQRRGLTRPWLANARPDELDPEVIAAARASGAVLLKIGVDTGSPRLIERLGKAANGDAWLEASRRAFRELARQGIGAVSLFMLGLPG